MTPTKRSSSTPLPLPKPHHGESTHRALLCAINNPNHHYLVPKGISQIPSTSTQLRRPQTLHLPLVLPESCPRLPPSLCELVAGLMQQGQKDRSFLREGPLPHSPNPRSLMGCQLSLEPSSQALHSQLCGLLREMGKGPLVPGLWLHGELQSQLQQLSLAQETPSPHCALGLTTRTELKSTEPSHEPHPHSSRAVTPGSGGPPPSNPQKCSKPGGTPNLGGLLS